MKTALLCLSLLATLAHADEMYPEINPQDQSAVVSKQIALGLADTGVYSILLSLKDPVVSRVKRLTRKAERISGRLTELQLDRKYSNPATREQAIKMSLATVQEQTEVDRARRLVLAAENLLTEGEHRQAYAAHLQAAAGSYSGWYETPSYLNIPPVKDAATRAERIAEANVELGRAHEKLLASLTAKGGELEQVHRFSAVGRVAKLEKELARMSQPKYIAYLSKVEQVTAQRFERLAGRPEALRAQAAAVGKTPARLQRALLWRVPQVLSAGFVADQLMRLAIYLDGRDPGYAPLATYLQAQFAGKAAPAETEP